MKKYPSIAFLFIFLFTTSALMGQRVNISDFEVNARYLIPPETGFDTTISVYHVEMLANEAKLSFINRSSASLNKQIKISGYTKVNEEIGPKVEITFFGPDNTKAELKKQTRKKKNGSKYTLYSYEYIFSASANVRVLDESGQLIKEFKEASMETKSTSNKRSLSAAKTEVNQKSRKLRFNGRKMVLDNVVKAINRKLNVEWGLRPHTYEVEFEFPKKKKHHHYSKWNPYKENVTAAFAQMTPASNKDYLKHMQPAIDFWVKMAPTYPQDDRKLRKMNFASLYNAALAYFWAEDFDNARLYAKKVANGEYREGKGRRLLRDIDKMETALDKVPLPALHYKVEIPEEIKQELEAKKAAREAAIAAGDITQHEDFNSKMNLKTNSKVVPGSIHFKNGNKTKGYFVFESKSDIPDFREPKKIRFGHKNKTGGINQLTLSYQLYNGFELDGKWFDIQEKLQLETGLIDLKLNNAIVYKGSEFKKTYMGIVYPPMKYGKVMGQTNELHPELIVYNKAKEEYITVRPTVLRSFPKSMQIITGEDCAEVMAYLENYKEREPAATQIETDEKRFQYAAHTYEVMKLYDACGGEEMVEGK